MSAIGALGASYAVLAAGYAGGGRAGLETQLGVLQQQCAEVGGCTTTPTTEKFKQEGELNGRIAAVRGQLCALQDRETTGGTAAAAVISSGSQNQIDLYV